MDLSFAMFILWQLSQKFISADIFGIIFINKITPLFCAADIINMTMQTFCNGANLGEYLYYFCEDTMAKRRRKYRYRFDEAMVRYTDKSPEPGFLIILCLPGADKRLRTCYRRLSRPF